MKTFLATLACLTLTLLHCRAADTNSIIGHWQTGVEVTKGGTYVVEYSFTTNGMFVVSERFTPPAVLGTSIAGTYHVVTSTTGITNQLVTVARGGTNTASFYFQGSTLVIDEGRRPTKLFRLQP